jgi:hypothetical protein
MKLPIKKTVFISSLFILSLVGAIVLNRISSVHADTSSNQPASCPSGFIPVPGNSAYGTQGGFCVMKYEAEQGSNNTPISTGATAPWGNVTQIQAMNYSKNSCSGCHLIAENEWLTIANNIMNVASNWTGGAVGSGSLYTGYSSNSSVLTPSTNDTNGYSDTGATSGTSRRTFTLSNGEVIWDLAGNAPEWTQGTIATNRQNVTSSSEFSSLSPTNIDDFSPRILPSYNNSAASSYTSSNGIGSLYTSYSSTSSTSGFLRGGNVYSASYMMCPYTGCVQIGWMINSGIFTVVTYSPTASNNNVIYNPSGDGSGQGNCGYHCFERIVPFSFRVTK